MNWFLTFCGYLSTSEVFYITIFSGYLLSSVNFFLPSDLTGEWEENETWQKAHHLAVILSLVIIILECIDIRQQVGNGNDWQEKMFSQLFSMVKEINADNTIYRVEYSVCLCWEVLRGVISVIVYIHQSLEEYSFLLELV